MPGNEIIAEIHRARAEHARKCAVIRPHFPFLKSTARVEETAIRTAIAATAR